MSASLFDVDRLPPRVAHAVYALMAAANVSYGNGQGPFTAAEVCVYDAHWEALTPRHTGAALREAQEMGFAVYVAGGYWTPTNFSLEHRSEFTDRFLSDEAGA